VEEVEKVEAHDTPFAPKAQLKAISQFDRDGTVEVCY
jgi:hypothetical protein